MPPAPWRFFIVRLNSIARPSSVIGQNEGVLINIKSGRNQFNRKKICGINIFTLLHLIHLCNVKLFLKPLASQDENTPLLFQVLAMAWRLNLV